MGSVSMSRITGGVSLSGSRCRREVVVGELGNVYDCCLLQCHVW